MVAVGVALTGPGEDPSEVHALQTTERARLQALVAGDVESARRMMAADFEVINPAGGSASRAEYLDALGSGALDYRVFEPASPIAVRVADDSATLRFRARFDLDVGGSRVQHQGWVAELYERRSGRWQIVWEQATAIPNDTELFIRSIQAPD
jgi:hypothetical protein